MLLTIDFRHNFTALRALVVHAGAGNLVEAELCLLNVLLAHSTLLCIDNNLLIVICESALFDHSFLFFNVLQVYG